MSDIERVNEFTKGHERITDDESSIEDKEIDRSDEEYEDDEEEPYDPRTDPEIQHKEETAIVNKKVKKRIQKPLIENLVGMAELTGLNPKEGAKFVTRLLGGKVNLDDPNDKGDPKVNFSVQQYVRVMKRLDHIKMDMLNNYSSSGLFIDFVNNHQTVKYTFQRCLKLFIEQSSRQNPDVLSVTRLAYAIKDISEHLSKLELSAPFIQSLHGIIDNSVGALDRVRKKHPDIFEESYTGGIISISGEDGNDGQDSVGESFNAIRALPDSQESIQQKVEAETRIGDTTLSDTTGRTEIPRADSTRRAKTTESVF